MHSGLAAWVFVAGVAGMPASEDFLDYLNHLPPMRLDRTQPFAEGCLPETPAPRSAAAGSEERGRPAGILGFRKRERATDDDDAGRQAAWLTAHQTQDWWGTLKGQTQVQALGTEALAGERWQTEQALQAGLLGPLFVFGQFRAGYNTVAAQELKWSGLTGVGCKVEPLPGAELQLRGGSRLSYAEDPCQPKRLGKDRSEMLLELQARCLLFGPVSLEYVGAATPALDPLERNRLDQDLRLAVPLGTAGRLQLGARHSWQDTATPRPWNDGMQLYLGIGLRR